MTQQSNTGRIEIPLPQAAQSALAAMQSAIAGAVQQMLIAMEAERAGGLVDVILAALAGGHGQIVAHLAVLPAGPCVVEFVVGEKRYSLGALVFDPQRASN
jgi:hypothetical protein